MKILLKSFLTDCILKFCSNRHQGIVLHQSVISSGKIHTSNTIADKADSHNNPLATEYTEPITVVLTQWVFGPRRVGCESSALVSHRVHTHQPQVLAHCNFSPRLKPSPPPPQQRCLLKIAVERQVPQRITITPCTEMTPKKRTMQSVKPCEKRKECV